MRETDAVHEHYFRLVRTQGIAAELFALRNETAEARRICAYGATGGRLRLEEIYEALRSGAPLELSAEWAARLARVMAWQNYLPDDRQLAIDLGSRVIHELDGANVHHAKLRQAHVEVLLAESRFDAASTLLTGDQHFAGEHFWHYWADVCSPFLDSQYADYERWRSLFNAHFERYGLVGIGVGTGEGAPFDRVIAGAAEGARENEPLVTVIMTTFRPGRAPLLAAVRSILAQTWKNLEVIIVDDRSPEEYLATLLEVERLDSRIRIERMPANGGTYLARNRALELARGEFFTNQDADDWSHPQRIERQLQPLLDDRNLPGTRAAALTVDSNLRLTRPGYGYAQQHAATFMSRTELVKNLGGYLGARRAADNELHRRTETYTGRGVMELREPLALYRIEPESLSRGDFRAGWSHPARQSFIASYSHWHKYSRRSDLAVKHDRDRMVAIPRKFQVNASPQATPYDLVAVTDWRYDEPAQRAALDEVLVALDRRLRVGIVHMESPVHISPRRGHIATEVQRLINNHRVDRILVDDAVAVEHMVIRDPAVLQYAPIRTSRLEVSEITIALDDADIAAQGVYFSIDDCARTCQDTFGVVPSWRLESLRPDEGGWAAIGAKVRPLVHRRSWFADRRRWRGRAPVVGWTAEAYPARDVDPAVESYLAKAVGRSSKDFRIRGSESVCRTFANRPYSATWTRFRRSEIAARAFVHGLDFILATDPHPGSFRSYLEALVSGCVVVAPRSLQPVFQDAALYAEPADVTTVLSECHNNRPWYTKQVQRAQARATEICLVR